MRRSESDCGVCVCGGAQGCEDADSPHWINLRHHHNDTSIKMHGQFASWPVLGHAATIPCRMFRVLLTGDNANPLPRSDAVCLSSFEFYGYLHDVRVSGAQEEMV